MHAHRTLRLAAFLMILIQLLYCGVSAAENQDAEEVVRQGISNGEESIDLESFELYGEDLKQIYYRLRNSGQLPWYVDSYSYHYDVTTGIIYSMTPNYLDPEVYDRDLYEAALTSVLAEAVYPGMSQWQIALSVHDYLVSHFCYDETYSYYESYDLLVGGTAVCEGYARAYMELLSRAGLETRYVTSDAMDHGWNLVCIDGNWYHVDVTWDDPISDCYGRVNHNYFLLDDQTISDEKHSHYGWEVTESASSSDMNEGKFWHQTDSPICYESAETSYIRINESCKLRIYRRNEMTGELTELAYVDAGYIDVGRGSCHYQNYGLSLWNGRLYFSDMEQVYSINTDGTDLSVVYSIDAESEGYFIRGSFVDEGMIHVTFSDQDNNLQRMEIPLPGYVPHTHTYTESRTEPTCTSDGTVEQICSCGDRYVSQTLPAAGHQYDDGEITREATTSSAGILTYTCLSCGVSFTETIPALEETEPGTVPTQPAEPSVPETTIPVPDTTVPPEKPPQETTPSPETHSAKVSLPILPVVGGVVILAMISIAALRRKKPPETPVIFLDDSDDYDPDEYDSDNFFEEDDSDSEAYVPGFD